MMDPLIISSAFVIVGVGAMIAVFHPDVNDTVSERFSLACVSFTAFAAACRATSGGDGTPIFILSVAMYVAALFWKRFRGLTDAPPPQDKCRNRKSKTC